MRQPKDQLPVALELPVAPVQAAAWGATAGAYVRFSAGADAAPLLEGRPNDKCPCPHWGYILEGAVHVSYADGEEEVCRAGEVFYWPAGHTVRVDEDTAFVEFSPKRELKDVYDHIGRKLSAGG